MKMHKFIVPARNKQEKIGTYLITLSSFLMIADSLFGGTNKEPVGISLSSPYFIGGILLALIGCVIMYESKRRNGTLSDLDVFRKYAPYVLLLGLIIFGAVFVFVTLI
jgi:hypothetical protein